MTKRPRLTIVDRPSPNFNDRKGESVRFLVLHYTAMATAEDAIQRLCDPSTGVSAHYVVGEDGTVYRLVAEENRAWHAGISFWDGATDINSSSVGIEIANTGDAPYPEAQMKSVIALSKAIVNRHKIRSFNVVGHSDIAPDRKPDPGELFDWQWLAAAGLGVWPVPTQADYKLSAGWTDADVKKALVKVGYRSTIDQRVLVTAFQRHFQPELFQTPAKVGIADLETKARLACLVRRKTIADAMRQKARHGRRNKV